ncbi:MAG: recombination protein RecR [Verrucomicrobia bacterium]|jgi:recombination protein RecR|nr:recombination protein RecR [Verrucomicrobiota bacterium]
MPPQGLEKLTRSLSRLPGVGRRSAERMAMKLASDPEGLVLPLIEALEETRRTVAFCSRCGAMTTVDRDPCRLCTDSLRDATTICVVEDPSDIVSMESTGAYTGRYHALMGKISPMRGDGPNDIRIRALVRRIKTEGIKEVVLALNTDIESEATAELIAGILKERGIRATRLAYGIPAGSGIRYADSVTLDRAIRGRQAL